MKNDGILPAELIEAIERQQSVKIARGIMNYNVPEEINLEQKLMTLSEFKSRVEILRTNGKNSKESPLAKEKANASRSGVVKLSKGARLKGLRPSLGITMTPETLKVDKISKNPINVETLLVSPLSNNLIAMQ